MTREHEQAIKILESFTDHFHRNIEQAEKANDNAFNFTQAEDAVITFGIAIQAIKDLDKMQNVLDEIRVEIEEERKGYPPSADEYKTINKVLQIIDKYNDRK